MSGAFALMASSGWLLASGVLVFRSRRFAAVLMGLLALLSPLSRAGACASAAPEGAARVAHLPGESHDTGSRPHDGHDDGGRGEGSSHCLAGATCAVTEAPESAMQVTGAPMPRAVAQALDERAPAVTRLAPEPPPPRG